MKDEMFKLHLQTFGEEPEEDTEPKEGGEDTVPEPQPDEEDVDVRTKLEQMERKYQENLESEKKRLEKVFKDKESLLEKRLKQIEDLSLDSKKKEQLRDIQDKEKQIEERNALQQRLDAMEKEMKIKEHQVNIKDYIASNPYLKGHIEHTKSKEELDGLIKREGENWKRLYQYENDKNKNRNVMRGYRQNPNISDDKILEEKEKKYKERFSKFLPHKKG